MKALLPPLAFIVAFFDASAGLHADMVADFAWFGQLGFPDVQKLQFVRYIGGWSSTGQGGMEPMWTNGFLLEDNADEFRVLTLSFNPLPLTKSAKQASREYRYEPGDLRVFAEAELQPADPQEKLLRGHFLIAGPHFTDRTHLFVLGWICARQGLDDLAARLYAAAQTANGLEQRGTRDAAQSEKNWSFRDKLERDLGHFEMWRTIVDFGDLRITRPELLARLRALPERFPHCDHLVRADSLARQLERMIAEDDAHPARTAEEIAALPPPEQAQEWIFRLRDQHGYQMGQPGWVDIFMTDNLHHDSPADQLVKLGDAAVPALIATLDDTRLTRSVGYGRDFFFSHEIVTIGDAALKIVERISGRHFYSSGSIQGSMSLDGKTALVRDAVQAWWDRHQAKGELGELAETTARGGFGSAQVAAKLLAEFPNDAATPILAGAAAAQRADERCAFIRLVGKLKDDRAPEFLLREARGGPLTGSRAEAAWQLAKQGRLEGIAPLAEVWRRSPPSSKWEETSAREKLIGVLALADSPEGIHALADGLHERGITARRYVIEALGGGWNTFMNLDEVTPPGNARPALSAPTAAAMEDLLAAEVEDTAGYTGVSGWRGGRRVDNPRLCDEAAGLLAARWPDRYVFDSGAPYPVRERQRVICANVWRQAHGQPLLSLPLERPRVAPGDELKVAEVVFAGEGIKWPEPLAGLLHAAQGRPLDAALFREIERTFLAACAGQPPAGDRGFFVDAFRENATDGITLIVVPVERHGLAERPEREWRLEYRAVLDGREQLNASRADLFGRSIDGDAGRVDEMFRKIAALSVERPFHLHMELAPDLCDVDTAF